VFGEYLAPRKISGLAERPAKPRAKSATSGRRKLGAAKMTEICPGLTPLWDSPSLRDSGDATLWGA
jgi:hypothetical protein